MRKTETADWVLISIYIFAIYNTFATYTKNVITEKRQYSEIVKGMKSVKLQFRFKND